MYIRFLANEEISYGVLEGDKVKKIAGDLFQEQVTVTDETVDVAEVTLLAPCEPSKVVCVGLNYKDHAEEMDLALPKEPLLFLKPSTTVIGPNAAVHYPVNSEHVEYEAELAIVIKKTAKNVEENAALDYVLGYTCANDMSARDIQFGDGQWTRGKSFDTFCPLGPGIVETIDLDNAKIELTVNGEVKQSSDLSQLIFKVPYLVSYISKHMTLNPGDVIITGTPHGVGPVKRNDTMTVKIAGIGELKNQIV